MDVVEYSKCRLPRSALCNEENTFFGSIAPKTNFFYLSSCQRTHFALIFFRIVTSEYKIWANGHKIRLITFVVMYTTEVTSFNMDKCLSARTVDSDKVQ